MQIDLQKSKEAGKKAFEIAKWFSKKTAKLMRDSTLVARPFNKKELLRLSKVEPYLEERELNKLKFFIKQGKAKIKLVRFGWSFLVSGKDILPKAVFIMPEKRKFNPDFDVEVKTRLWTEELDKKIRKNFFLARFKEFAERSSTAVKEFIAPNLIGLTEIKQAIALQLFSKDPVHILLVGEQGSGKTELLKSAPNLATTSTFADRDSMNNLIVNLSNKKISQGLLSMASNGLCCIDGLNYIKKKDRIELATAIETNFINYNLDGKQHVFDVQASILATTNSLENIDKQLLEKFHFVFFVKKVQMEQFSDLAEKLISEEKVKANQNDLLFVKRYVRYGSKLDPKLPPIIADKVKSFVIDLKEKESNLPFEVTPKTVVGITKFLKASARMDLREKIEAKDFLP